MPNRRKTDGTFQDIAHPIHRRMRERLEERILDEYHTVQDELATL
jgi:DNA-binding cell septation regulator SpoVG